MNRISRLLLRGTVLAGGLFCLSHNTDAQQTDDNIRQWRFGLFGGIGYNYVEASLQRYMSIGADPFFGSRDYSKASEFTSYGGIGAEYILTPLFGVGLRVAYDDRTISKDVNGSTLTPHISYISIEPALRLNIYSGLHFNIGPSVSLPIRHVYDYTPIDGEAGAPLSDAELQNINDISAGAWGGFGYDIALNSNSHSLRWYITPFVEGSWLYDQKKPDAPQSNLDQKWTTLTARAGMQVKLGPAPEATPVTAAPPADPSLNISIRTPRNGVLQPRDIIEHMPLVNYLFFDKDSTGIPARYVRLQPKNAANFDEGELTQEITTGSSTATVTQPEERQMQVYYNMLNIFGERLAKSTGTRIRLVGSAPDQKDGLAMAENVKNYLVTAFGITPDRIATKGQTRPPHASGTRATPKEDLHLVMAENRRVEILTDDQQLLEPVQIQTRLKEPVMNNLNIEITAPARIESWTVTITGEEYSRTYGPFHSGTQRINATPILGDNKQGTYKATIAAVMENGGTLTEETTFTLNRTERPPLAANRYSILFEYDESKTVEMYERFLRRTVAPLLPENSLVYVHGHTDIIGDYEYNSDLSMRRAETTMVILDDEINRLERDVIFDVYGFGEDRDEAPFENESPEERHYNRTIVIDVFEGM